MSTSDPTDLAIIAPDRDLMMAARETDPEWISHETQIRLLEQQARGALGRWVDSTVEIGEILRDHRDLCRDQGERPAALWEALGLTRSTAYRMISASELARTYPQLRNMAANSYTRAAALIEGATPELISRIAEDQEPEIPRDDLDTMSVRELKRRLKSVQEQTDKEVRRQTKTLTAERDALIKERDRLAALTGDDLDSIRRTVSVLREQAAAVATTVTALHRQFEAVSLVEAMSPRGQLLLDQIEQELHGHGAATGALWQTWLERRENDWGRAGTLGDPD